MPSSGLPQQPQAHPSDVECGPAFAKYKAYTFDLGTLNLFKAKLEEKRGSANEYSKNLKQLETAWSEMYTENCAILEHNFSCLACNDCGKSASNIENKLFAYSMRRIKALTKTLNVQTIGSKALKVIEGDLLHFEDTFLDLHEVHCRSLEVVRLFVIGRRRDYNLAKNKRNADSSVQQTSASNDIPSLGNPSTATPNQSTLRRDRKYTKYHLEMQDLLIVLNLKKQDSRLLKDTWIQMYVNANRTWTENMTCPLCGPAPGNETTGHRFSTARDRYGRIRDAFLSVDPETLQQEDLDDFVKGLDVTEDEYLQDNVNTKCKGLRELREKIQEYRYMAQGTFSVIKAVV